MIPTRPILLATLLLLPTAAAGPAYPLFEDAVGDAGPLAAWGTPVPGLSNGHADLTRATLTLGDTAASYVLELSALPEELPPDVVYFGGWTRSDGLLVAFGHVRIVNAEHPRGVESSVMCLFEEDPAEAGEADCIEIEMERLPSGFDFLAPLEALGDGTLGGPMAAVVRIPEETAWPLFLAHFTGLTVEDFAQGEDLVIPLPAPGEGVSAQSTGAGRAVPLPAVGVVLAAIAGVAAALRRRA